MAEDWPEPTSGGRQEVGVLRSVVFYHEARKYIFILALRTLSHPRTAPSHPSRYKGGTVVSFRFL